MIPAMDKRTVNIFSYPAGTWIEHSLIFLSSMAIYGGGWGEGGGCMPPDTCVIAISCMLTPAMDN